MSRIRVIVADDHGVVRKGLRLQLQQNSAFEVVAEATEGREAVRLGGGVAPGCRLDGYLHAQPEWHSGDFPNG